MPLGTGKRTRSIPTVLIAVAFMLTAVEGVVEAQSSGHRKTDKLIRRAQQTTSAIRSTLFQIQNTMDGYNSIMDGKASDNRAAYKKLVKDISRCRREAENVGKRTDAMQKVADAFFTDWEESLAGFNSEEMRAKSEARMNETRANYDKIFEAGRQARDRFDPFISDMDDQVRFLGHDLNPSGIADLQDEAEKLNADAGKLTDAITETIKVAVQYSNSLKPD